MEVIANNNSGGNQLETDSLLGGGGASEAGRNFSSRFKRLVDEMKDMLVVMPAMASNVALEVVRLLKNSKALVSATTSNLAVNMDGLRTEAEVVNCVGFEYRQDEEGEPFNCCALCYKAAASDRVLYTITYNL
jgi:hypothetical protein